MNNDLISRSALKAELAKCGYDIADFGGLFFIIDNAPTVELDESVIQEVLNKRCMTAVADEYLIALHGNSKKPKDEWIRKEDVIHSIAKQYSEHNELVPIWLSIGDLKGGAE